MTSQGSEHLGESFLLVKMIMYRMTDSRELRNGIIGFVSKLPLLDRNFLSDYLLSIRVDAENVRRKRISACCRGHLEHAAIKKNGLEEAMPDEKDQIMLQLLRKDGRISFTELGKKTGMTRVAAKKRVKKLEEAGYIRGYQALIPEEVLNGEVPTMNVRDIQVFKDQGKDKDARNVSYDVDISDLNLSVRSYNCLRRAGCDSIQDVISLIAEDGLGKIRNLGVKSKAEIEGAVKNYMDSDAMAMARSGAGSGSASGSGSGSGSGFSGAGAGQPQPKRRVLAEPAKSLWDTEIGAFHLTGKTIRDLSACGIRVVGDLYRKDPAGKEPGWYAVRELFEKILNG